MIEYGDEEVIYTVLKRTYLKCVRSNSYTNNKEVVHVKSYLIASEQIVDSLYQDSVTKSCTITFSAR